MLSPCSIVTMFVLRSIRKSKKIIGGTIKNGHSRDAGNNAQKKDKKKNPHHIQPERQATLIWPNYGDELRLVTSLAENYVRAI